MDSCILAAVKLVSLHPSLDQHQIYAKMKYCLVFLTALTLGAAINPANFFGLFGDNNIDPLNGGAYDARRTCPGCDSSVYSYCSDKLFHDSCCCYVPNRYNDRLPYQCRFADCSFLHANSCDEHKLITRCCCIDRFYNK